MGFLKKLTLLVFSIVFVVGAVEIGSKIILENFGDHYFYYSLRSDEPLLKSEIPTSLKSYREPHNDPYKPLRAGPTAMEDTLMMDMGSALVPKANAKGYRKRIFSDTHEVIQFYNYSTDQVRRRIVPGNSGQRKKQAAIFGCSFTFGESVEDHETLPYFLQAKTKDYDFFNLGYSGYSINELYVRAKKMDFLTGLESKPGFGVYIMFEDHIARSLGGMRDGGWRRDLVKIEERGEFEFEDVGRFKEHGWWFDGVLSKIANSNFGALFRIDFPVLSDHERVDQFVRKIKGLEKLYKQKTLESNEFYVVIYPLPMTYKVRLRLRKTLAQYNIRFLDYGAYSISDYIDGMSSMPDGHPNAASHELFAKILVDDLNLQ